MQLTMLKGKIHRAVVKQAELNYVGSITIDPKLMEAAGILEYEQVQIVAGQRHDLFKRCGGKTGAGRRPCNYHGILPDGCQRSRRPQAKGRLCR